MRYYSATGGGDVLRWFPIVEETCRMSLTSIGMAATRRRPVPAQNSKTFCFWSSPAQTSMKKCIIFSQKKCANQQTKFQAFASCG